VEKLKKYSPQILASTWFAIFSMGMYFPNFAKFLGFSKGPKPFMDLQQVLSAGDCRDKTTEKLLMGVCDPWSRPIPYPSWILKLVQLVHASNSYALIIGWINAILIAFSIYYLARKCKQRIILFGIAVLAPPMFFLAERGNIDSIILFLTIFFIISENRNRGPWHLWIPGVLTAFKIYPIGIFFALTKKRNFVISIVISLLLLPLWLGDLGTILGNQPHSRGWSYGNIILLTQDMDKFYPIGYIDFKITLFVALVTLLIWLTAYGLAIVTIKSEIEEFIQTLQENTLAKTMFLSGSFIFLVTFVGISVVDYKLWTALLTIAALLMLKPKSHHRLTNALITFLLFGMWCSRYTPSYIEFFGDLSLYFAATVLFVINLQYMLKMLKNLKISTKNIS
jgi:hypothetical protein